jgi:hypothetical protein
MRQDSELGARQDYSSKSEVDATYKSIGQTGYISHQSSNNMRG